MTSERSKTSRVVKFAATDADHALLQTIEAALQQRSTSFSDLCKQALRQLLLPETAPTSLSLLATLEQQLMTLQLQVMQLEQQPRAVSTAAFQQLEQQVQQLGERLAHLEEPASSATAASEPAEPAPDPLLARLAPLLEDF